MKWFFRVFIILLFSIVLCHISFALSTDQLKENESIVSYMDMYEILSEKDIEVDEYALEVFSGFFERFDKGTYLIDNDIILKYIDKDLHFLESLMLMNKDQLIAKVFHSFKR